MNFITYFKKIFQKLKQSSYPDFYMVICTSITAAVASRFLLIFQKNNISTMTVLLTYHFHCCSLITYESFFFKLIVSIYEHVTFLSCLSTLPGVTHLVIVLLMSHMHFKYFEVLNGVWSLKINLQSFAQSKYEDFLISKNKDFGSSYMHEVFSLV